MCCTANTTPAGSKKEFSDEPQSATWRNEFDRRGPVPSVPRYVLRKPPAQKLLQCSVIHGFGEEFRALLVAPRVIQRQSALPFAEVQVGIVQVLCHSDFRTLFRIELS